MTTVFSYVFFYSLIYEFSHLEHKTSLGLVVWPRKFGDAAAPRRPTRRRLLFLVWRRLNEDLRAAYVNKISVCLSIYLSIYLSTYMYMHIHMNMHIHMHIHMNMHIHMHIHMYMHIHMHMHMNMHIHMHMHMFMYIHVCVCTHKHTSNTSMSSCHRARHICVRSHTRTTSASMCV